MFVIQSVDSINFVLLGRFFVRFCLIEETFFWTYATYYSYCTVSNGSVNYFALTSYLGPNIYYFGYYFNFQP